MAVSAFTKIGRGKATLIHFVSSSCVLLLIFLFTHWIWYPGPLLEATNALEIMTIIVAVDLSLGPMMMFVIFKPGKTSLRFDIGIVILIQLGFLAYGCASIFEARPVYIAYVESHFNLVTANELDPKDLNQSKLFNRLPLTGPIFVGTKAATDPRQLRDIQFAKIMGLGLQNLPQNYAPIEETKNVLIEHAYFGSTLTKFENASSKRLMAIESKEQKAGRSIGFIPLIGKKKILYVVIDRITGEILRIES